MAAKVNEPGHENSVCPVVGSELFFSRGGRVLLDIPRITFGAEDSRFTMIVGPNGAGKSVMVRTLCNLVTLDSGKVSWAGSAPDRARRHRVGLMLQKPVLLRRSALANLVYALQQLGHDRKRSVSIAEVALAEAGLHQIGPVQAHQLSGGEQQRLALLRALLLKPEILFLDEATANVDPASTLVIEQQLLKAVDTGLNVVMVSHDQGQVKRLGDYVVLMHHGRVLEHASAAEFFEQPRSIMTQRWIAGELLV